MSRKRWTVDISFDGAVLKSLPMEAFNVEDAVRRCILALRRMPCQQANPRDRCPLSGELHAHIPARFFDPTPIRRGDLDYFVARLPVIGEISYNFDAEHTVPPPITFRATYP